ncbi:MAG: glucosamine-6-phosphate deaminase [Oscillospiraceae bacterium]|jgi:glucosamine-6-phosphate deaminase|nr:glucosamine-6-phosphate deaminase [Oscillospiraceae bacterium]
MNVQILQDAQSIGRIVGDMLCDTVRQKPDAVLGLATGASPIPTYRHIAEQCAAGKASFAQVQSFNLDEYCDLPPTHPCSFHSFMARELFSHIDIPVSNCHFLDGNAPDTLAESERYRQAIEAAGGIDVQLLGIGRNGHIGFNEPAERFTGEAYRAALTQSTLDANACYFTDTPMPRYAMTMGVGQILRARKMLLIATGEVKAWAVREMCRGKISPRCPATALQNHPNVFIYLDSAAAALL